jgi:hypothetical protein
MAVTQIFSAFIADVSFLDTLYVRFGRSPLFVQKIAKDSCSHHDNDVFHFDLTFLGLILKQKYFQNQISPFQYV